MNSNKIALVLLNIIIFAGIFFAIYNFYYLEKKAILRDKTNIYNKFYNIKVQVDDFDNIRNNIKDQEYRLEEIFAIYNDYYKTNDEIVNSYRDLVEDFLKQHEIKITSTTITQEMGDGSNMVLLLSFKTSYDILYQLIFDMERFSNISDLQFSYLGDVSFKCSPYLYSQEINDYFAGRKELSMGEMEADGYFKEISDKVIAEMNIGEYATWKDLFPVPKNPFFPGYVYRKDISSKKKGTAKVYKPLPSGIVLQGVMYESNVPIAIIDGSLFKEGAVHKGVKIVKINKNNVDVEYYGNIFKLKMAN